MWVACCRCHQRRECSCYVDQRWKDLVVVGRACTIFPRPARSKPADPRLALASDSVGWQKSAGIDARKASRKPVKPTCRTPGRSEVGVSHGKQILRMAWHEQYLPSLL